MLSDRRLTWLFFALTLVLAGYFMEWLSHAGAGLSYTGLEIGEQAKFLSQVRSGEIVPGRSLFYVPPISVGLIIVLTSSRWPDYRWQTWVARGLGPGIALLAFPAFEALGTESAEWLWRVVLIGLVFALAIASPLLNRIRPARFWAIVGVIAFLGAVMPAWVFLEVRAAYSVVLQQSLGVGLGFWLNTVGQLMVGLLALVTFSKQPRSA